MSPTRADLDNLDTDLHSSAAASMAARRAAWSGLSARQRRRMAKQAARDFCEWLRERDLDGRRHYS